MASGVKVTDEATQAYSDLKSGHKYRYVVFKISDDLKEIIVDSTVKESTYEEFLEALPPDQPRYIVYDFHYQLADGGKRDDVIMVSWCPDNTKVKKRMLHSTSKDALVKKVQFGGKQFHGTEVSDITKDVVMEALKKGKE